MRAGIKMSRGRVGKMFGSDGRVEDVVEIEGGEEEWVMKV